MTTVCLAALKACRVIFPHSMATFWNVVSSDLIESGSNSFATSFGFCAVQYVAFAKFFFVCT